jgi:uncharacterized protein (DUF362 family)
MEKRRDFLARASRVGLGLSLLPPLLHSDTSASRRHPTTYRGRVVLARDTQLTRGGANEHKALLQKLLDSAVLRLTDEHDATMAWRGLFRPDERVGIKVNCLGLSTQPAVAYAVAERLIHAGLPAENILIWDRFDVELARAGYRINKSRRGVRCYGTDTNGAGQGYEPTVETSGMVGSCFSRIVTEQVDALISVPVLKDHNLAGVSLGLKNFYGAIHNPNKYHDNNCDPYVTDVVSHPHIARKWRLTVCDGMRAQYHAGPSRAPHYAWLFGGLIVSADVVAADAVCVALIEEKRKQAGLRSLAAEDRPPKHVLTAGQRGLGEADPAKITRFEI